MSRNGKIARLPKAIRDQLNKNLEDGMPGVRLVEWLNSLPEVQQVLTEQFDGRAINEVNLTEWKGGGFLDWQARQDMKSHALELAEEAQDLKSAMPGVLAEHLNIIVAGRFAELLNQWNGDVDEGFMKKLKALRLLSHEVAVQRRGDQRAADGQRADRQQADMQTCRQEKLKLDREKFVEESKYMDEKALTGCLKRAKQWPEVVEGFRNVFVMQEQYESGKRNGREYEAKQRAKEAEAARLRKEAEDRRAHTSRAESAEQRRQWMEVHPGQHPGASNDWMYWKIDESKRLTDPALMPQAALFGGAPIDWSLVDKTKWKFLRKANKNEKIKPN
ncbi:MAG TPA: hypothetical protein VG347_04420 [Verrucomicrobiae bacterium]|nr:hypothetical protein [Verrucomicrobiae bacterium]